MKCNTLVEFMSYFRKVLYMSIQLKIIEKENLTNLNRETFAKMLKAQGKVRGDLSTKADRCKTICFAYCNGELAAIGAIKQKTQSDFTPHKANLSSLESQFDWELGYIYTDPNYEGKGFARNVVTALIESFGDGNLMASTEISKNPRMVDILKFNGFKHYGRQWKSDIHGNYLGLFLKLRE
ncbi:N-acetyltransferase [Providencia stuartii]|nr:N-acetyltransferase [Providencia stuartii]